MNTRHIAAVTVLLAAAVVPVTNADIINVPADQPTIQAGIDAAVDGDEVVVADGTYTGPGNRDMDFGGKAITVRSENGAVACTIDIQANDAAPHRAFRFDSGETAESVVEGFTIQNGFISQEAAEDGGGAVYMLGSSPTFVDCEFLQNQVEANFLFGGGGAVQCQSDSSPTFIGCTFNGNTAFGPQLQTTGGAVAIWDGGHPEFFSCTFTENQAYWDSAVYCAPSVTMLDCHFQDNVTVGGSGTYGQDGEPFGGGSSTFVNCSFIGNSAQGNSGGAVRLQGIGASLTLTNCLFAGNETTGGGGGLVLNFGAEVTVTNCTFVQNAAASSGGGIWVSGFGAPGTIANVDNCLFAGNQATQHGGGLHVNLGADATVTNCTFAQNTALFTGGGIALDGDGSSANVDNCILWDNLPQQINVSNNGTLSVSYSDIQGGWPGTGNIDADPMFGEPSNCCSPYGGLGCDDPGCQALVCDVDPFCCSVVWDQMCANFAADLCADLCSVDPRLGPGSPCIDAGDNTAVPPDITTDLDGNPRFVDDPDTGDTGFGDPPIVDMGAYEFQGSPCPWDLDGDGNVFVVDLLLLLMDFGSCDGSPADFDGDGCVTVVDLLILLGNWGPCPGSPCPWDVNGDGTVDKADLWQVLGNFGPCDGCPEDVNGDGVVNGQDAAAVATHFGPCP